LPMPGLGQSDTDRIPLVVGLIVNLIAAVCAFVVGSRSCHYFAGVEVDIRDSQGDTPLWRATMTSRGQDDVIKVLRDAGADPYAKNNTGNSPISIANFPIVQFYSDRP
jgi:ankyrin repeat protein